MYKMIFLLWFLLLLPLAVGAQPTDSKDSVTTLKLGDSTFAVPFGCQAISPYQIKCADYELVWLYFPHEQVNAVLENTLSGMGKNLPNFTKKKVDAFLFGSKCEGYKIHFTKDTQNIHQLIAYGPLGKYSVVVQVVLYHEINTNADLPEFARRILALTL